jgi:hypothetical protein
MVEGSVLLSARQRQIAERRPAASGQGSSVCTLTNEIFLYRVVDVVVTESGDMADMEDCYWLDVARVPMCDLLARRLRVVTPA